jgi:Leucine-rich repeat (LRR) protein
MGLTEVPCELFRMKSVKQLYLYNNNLCSLPSEIAHLAKLEALFVRLSKRFDRDLIALFQVYDNQLTCLPPELFLLTNLKRLYVRLSRLINLDLTHGRAFRSVTTSSRPCQKKAASCDSSSGSPCESRIEWIMI